MPQEPVDKTYETHANNTYQEQLQTQKKNRKDENGCHICGVIYYLPPGEPVNIDIAISWGKELERHVHALSNKRAREDD